MDLTALQVAGATKTINCSTWSHDENRYHIWWGRHLPHVLDTAAYGSSNNWWT